jgi:hypothetical protein
MMRGALTRDADLVIWGTSTGGLMSGRPGFQLFQRGRDVTLMKVNDRLDADLYLGQRRISHISFSSSVIFVLGKAWEGKQHHAKRVRTPGAGIPLPTLSPVRKLFTRQGSCLSKRASHLLKQPTHT